MPDGIGHHSSPLVADLAPATEVELNINRLRFARYLVRTHRLSEEIGPEECQDGGSGLTADEPK
jgi:hypothetical protein